MLKMWCFFHGRWWFHHGKKGSSMGFEWDFEIGLEKNMTDFPAAMFDHRRAIYLEEFLSLSRYDPILILIVKPLYCHDFPINWVI